MLGEGIIDYKTISEYSIEGLDEIVKEHLSDGWALRGFMVVGFVSRHISGSPPGTPSVDGTTYNQTMVLPDTWVPPLGGGR